MPRVARLIVPGKFYHITQRGNYKQILFHSKADYCYYLELLGHSAIKWQTKIIAFCLMPNHVHFIAMPERSFSFAKTFGVAHMRYAQYKNKQRQQTGHLWQSRYYSTVLTEGHFYVAIRYVERNPVRAKLVSKPWDWPFSSAKAHIGTGQPLIELMDYTQFLDVVSWKQFLGAHF